MKLQPLVMHLVYRLDFGGLETLLVECVNRMPAEKYRHIIVCLTDFSEFSKKISRHDVEILSLHKQPGWGLKSHVDFWWLCKKWKPQILHTYNLPTIEYTFTGFFAGVPIRIHAEHGRDINDPEGKIWKYKVLRKLLKPLIDYFVPVSIELKNWLSTAIGVPQRKIRLINNGVDLQRFHLKTAPPVHLEKTENLPAQLFVIGTVGRIQEVKNHVALIDAFVLLRKNFPEMKESLRLMIIGDGPLLNALKEKVAREDLREFVSLPGARDDIPEILNTMSLFAMSSLAEGTPVVMLEAMASSLPVVATDVGGIPDLLQHGVTGQLVERANVPALAQAMGCYLRTPELLQQHGTAARRWVESHYSLEAMLGEYLSLYDQSCAEKLH